MNTVQKQLAAARRWGIPSATALAVLARDTCCIYCARPFGPARAEQPSWEHIINDVALHGPDNIALCCIACNASKGNRPLATWLTSKGAQRRGICKERVALVAQAALHHGS